MSDLVIRNRNLVICNRNTCFAAQSLTLLADLLLGESF